MRRVGIAVGRLKQGPERDLAAAYRKRAEAVGRGRGVSDIEKGEIPETPPPGNQPRRPPE